MKVIADIFVKLESLLMAYVCCGPKAHFHIVEQSFSIFNIGSKKMKMSRVSVMRKFQTPLVLLKRTHCIG